MTQVFSYLPEEEKGKYKTKKQWLKLGFVPTSIHAGTAMYANGHRQKKFLYLTATEVRKATEEELAPYREAERTKRRNRWLKEKKERERGKRQIELMALCKRQGELDREKYAEVIPTRDVTIDIETTGLDIYEDEILQVSILDANTGETLLNSYVKPYFTEDWPEARKVNRITKEMVQNAPYLHEVLPRINEVLAQVKMVIGYNCAQFDRPFMEFYGANFNADTIMQDLIFLFAAVYGEFSPKYGDFKLKNLSFCAEYFGYDWGEDKAHDSLADCRATAYCYKKWQEEKYQELYVLNIARRDAGYYEEEGGECG